MENEERAHLKSLYQTELESVKNEVARLTDLLELLLRAKNGEGTSTQPPAGAPTAHIPQASQNQGQIQPMNNTLCPSPLSSHFMLQSLWN